MKIDKRTGRFNLEGATPLDDFAYQLYINRFKQRPDYKKAWKSSQKNFIKKNDIICEYYKNDFYQEAKMILRRQKINKIRNGKV